MGLVLLRKGSHNKEIKISFTMNSKTCVVAGVRSKGKLLENCKRKVIIKKNTTQKESLKITKLCLLDFSRVHFINNRVRLRKIYAISSSVNLTNLLLAIFIQVMFGSVSKTPTNFGGKLPKLRHR